ncbi:tRNA threonylcarbamoyladenosine biosynthesis protein TsaE [Aquimarina sp. EL_43]|uniref:tRNA (adenosine(37)-N6)-threonylcarbamoyltransferase complex ATPase subunit type 1 TsaE n=1 Tax=Aquimarina TaxID=290174 RepID=UPI0004712BBC|nr:MULTISPECIES: tRNA (adenosine(37)-N6)-threonylcarbamoyltransferase complex ATPase subunit type 1 TsaE [Aquimarina]MBG6129779.1 tRNA threonylcarbamoyladenosine biosynthesis protein TsaE [Aquimarina sp. EL_35]MBG6150844.1 tRNA threonylcarbamoyladenosine biosynthesis protein TsaE [Aquimarina sp. EL_32]MBG6167849.1 tRNA threonylcarbamoyladenosine biosynthesis protein TsaE [Aquimarina sp. EL_43]
MTIEYTLQDLPDVAEKIISNVANKIILFNAEMGVGKTTLIKEICKHLGVEDIISSPTYSLVNEYESNDGVIYHFDFYRIKEEEEAYQIGFEEYLDSDAWIFIEWPEKISGLLPENSVSITINLLDNEKRILSF